MATVYRRITPDNYAAALAEAEAAVPPAEAKRDRLKRAYEQRVAPRSEAETDPASAFRRRTPGQARKAGKKFELDMEAYKAYEAAEREYSLCASRALRLRQSAPVPYTEEQLRAAVAVRTDDGWFKLLKVNKVTVGVDAGFPWPHKIRRELVLEVKEAAPEPEEGDASSPDTSTGDEAEEVRRAVSMFQAAADCGGDDAEHDAAVALARAALNLADTVEPGSPTGEVSDDQ